MGSEHEDLIPEKYFIHSHSSHTQNIVYNEKLLELWGKEQS